MNFIVRKVIYSTSIVPMAEYIISRIFIVYINDTAVNIRVCVCVLEQNPQSKLLHNDETTQIKLKTSNSGYF